MTNYEKILKKGMKGKEELIKALAEFVAREIRWYARTEDECTDIEISNFELYDIEQDLRKFFDYEGKKKDDK